MSDIVETTEDSNFTKEVNNLFHRLQEIKPHQNKDMQAFNRLYELYRQNPKSSAGIYTDLVALHHTNFFFDFINVKNNGGFFNPDKSGDLIMNTFNFSGFKGSFEVTIEYDGGTLTITPYGLMPEQTIIASRSKGQTLLLAKGFKIGTRIFSIEFKSRNYPDKAFFLRTKDIKFK